MKWSCFRCKRPVKVSWWQQFLRFPFNRVECESLASCLFFIQITTEDEPGPIWYEREPEDAWVCSRCHGFGEYPTGQDWETGALNLEACTRCGTRGVEPRYTEPVS